MGRESLFTRSIEYSTTLGRVEMFRSPPLSRTESVIHAEAALMRAFLRRLPEAAESLYRRAAPAIYSLGFLLFRDGAKAEELVEMTLVRAWRQAVTFDPCTVRLDSWILAIARDIVVATLSGARPGRSATAPSDVLREAMIRNPSGRSDHTEKATLLPSIG